MKKAIFPFLAVSAFASLAAAGETIEMSPLQVREAPLSELKTTGLDTSVAGHLQFLPGGRVLAQGIPGGSADLSIRGSAFSGAGLNFGGLALRNAQTEHFHADLPFPAWWFAQPVVRTGAAQAVMGEGHLSGTVTLYPLKFRNRRVFTAGVDQEGGFSFEGGLQYEQETLHGNSFGLGAFAGYSDLPNVDNLGNDVESIRAGAQMQYHSPFGQGDVWFGFQEKTFGATGYYGVNPDFEAEEKTEDMLVLATWRSFDPVSPFDFGVSIREFKDDYRLQLPSGEFRNEHTTNQRMIQGGRRFAFSDTAGLTLRAAAEQEEIRSTNLGNFDRYRLSGTVLPDVSLGGGVRIMAGVRGEILEDFDDELLPIARMELALDPALSFYVEFSQTIRQPSYTELNYESPASLGNAGLEVQSQDNLEIGLNWIPREGTFASVAVFRHDSKNTVDWIRRDADSARWEAENIGDVETRGIELLLRQAVSPDLDLTGSFTWLDKDADDAPFASRYALDYAEQTLTVQADWRASEQVQVEAVQSWLNQVSNPLRDRGGDTQFLTTLAVHAHPADMPNVRFSLTGSNLFDDDFRVFAGQDTYTERRFTASVAVEW